MMFSLPDLCLLISILQNTMLFAILQEEIVCGRNAALVAEAATLRPF